MVQGDGKSSDTSVFEFPNRCASMAIQWVSIDSQEWLGVPAVYGISCDVIILNRPHSPDTQNITTTLAAIRNKHGKHEKKICMAIFLLWGNHQAVVA